MAERHRRASTLPDTPTSRDAIVDAAEELFADQGFVGVAISDVCKASGFPVGSIYHHFRNKAGLLNAVLQRGSDRFFAALLGISSPDESPELRLRIHYERIADLVAEHSRILRLLFVLQMQGPNDPEVRAIVGTTTERTTQRLTAVIEPLVVRAGVAHPRELATELAEFTLIHTAGLIIATSGRDVDMRASMQRVYRFIMFSLQERCAVPGDGDPLSVE